MCLSFSWYLLFIPERARWESNIHESHWNVNDSPMLSLLNNNNKTPRRNEKNKIYFDENLHLNQLNVKQIWWDLYSKKTNNVDERWLVGVCDYFCLMMIVFFISCLFSVFSVDFLIKHPSLSYGLIVISSFHSNTCIMFSLTKIIDISISPDFAKMKKNKL